MADIISNFPVKQVGFGALIGACSASTVKRWTKDVAYGIGMGVVILQTLSHYGFVHVNWHAIKAKTEQALDQDGDGKFELGDVKILLNKVIAVLSNGVPDAVGFSAGFYAGLKYL